MKKVVISILLVLPLFLIVVISLLGQVYSDFNNVAVEKVELYGDADDLLTRDKLFRLQKGEEKHVFVRILPQLATNKNYTFVSSDESVCVAVSDEDGITLRGENYGSAFITVTTENGNKTAIIPVSVRDDFVSRVEFESNDITIGVGEEKKLIVNVYAETAVDKRVVFSVPDEYKGILSVDQSGTVKGLGEGEGYVVATTVDGKLEARCRIKVEGGAPLFFNKPAGTPDLWYIDKNVIDLKEYLVVNIDGKTIDDVKFVIESGGKNASIANGVLTVATENKPIIVKAYVGEGESGYSATVTLMFVTQKSQIVIGNR